MEECGWSSWSHIVALSMPSVLHMLLTVPLIVLQTMLLIVPAMTYGSLGSATSPTISSVRMPHGNPPLVLTVQILCDMWQPFVLPRQHVDVSSMDATSPLFVVVVTKLQSSIAFAYAVHLM